MLGRGHGRTGVRRGGGREAAHGRHGRHNPRVGRRRRRVVEGAAAAARAEAAAGVGVRGHAEAVLLLLLLLLLLLHEAAGLLWLLPIHNHNCYVFLSFFSVGNGIWMVGLPLLHGFVRSISFSSSSSSSLCLALYAGCRVTSEAE